MVAGYFDDQVGPLKRAAIDAWMKSHSQGTWQIQGDRYTEDSATGGGAYVTRPNENGEGGGDWETDNVIADILRGRPRPGVPEGVQRHPHQDRQCAGTPGAGSPRPMASTAGGGDAAGQPQALGGRGGRGRQGHRRRAERRLHQPHPRELRRNGRGHDHHLQVRLSRAAQQGRGRAARDHHHSRWAPRGRAEDVGGRQGQRAQHHQAQHGCLQCRSEGRRLRLESLLKVAGWAVAGGTIFATGGATKALGVTTSG